MNNELFTNRLQEIMDYYNLTASALAERLGVGRSSISHIISGRNKPSLDFVMHIIENFKEVDFDWLLRGKGSFPSTTPSTSTTTLFPEDSPAKETEIVTHAPKNVSFPKKTEEKQLFTNVNTNNTAKDPSITSEKRVDRIVIFYSDHSFDEYKN